MMYEVNGVEVREVVSAGKKEGTFVRTFLFENMGDRAAYVVMGADSNVVASEGAFEAVASPAGWDVKASAAKVGKTGMVSVTVEAK